MNRKKFFSSVRDTRRGSSRGRMLMVLTAAVGIWVAGCTTMPNHVDAFSEPAEGVTGQQIILTNQVNPEWLRPPTNLFTLGPGDRLEIELIGETNSNTQTIVCPDGKIYFNVLEGVDVWGLTLSEAKAVLEERLAEQIRNGPKVSVALRQVESQRIWVLGRVQTPGVYPLTGPTTLLEAIARAGGTMSFTSERDVPMSAAVQELADLGRSFVIRDGRLLPINFDRLMNRGDLSQNIYLQSGDFIYLPPATAPEVFVLGAVGQPRSVPYVEGLTMVGAIASSYGTVKDAYLSQVAVLRGAMDRPEVMVVDYHDVVRGRARDVSLQPGDIVYVPYSPYRYLVKYVDTILNTFAASVAINAGSSLILRQPTGQGGVFIPVGSRVQVIPPPPPIQ